jgi:hypothetical protein
MAVSLVPVGPSIGDPAALAVLKSHEDAIRDSQQPGYPTAVLTTTIAALPAPSEAGSHIAIV